MALFLNVVVPVVVALTILLGSFLRPRMAVGLFLYAILFCPNIRIGGLELRLEHAVAPMLLGVIILSRPVALIRAVRCPPILAYLLWFGWCFTMTVIWSLPDLANPQSWVAVQGVFRPVLIMAIFAVVVFDGAQFKNLFKGFVLCGIPLACLGIAQTLNFPGARWITQQAYSSSGRDTFSISLESESQGYMVRGISVFENASYAGVFYILVLLAGIWLLAGKASLVSRKEKLALSLAVGFALLGGIFTMSATFVVGVLALGAILFARTRMRAKARIAIGVTGIALLLMLAMLLLPANFVSYFSDAHLYQKERVLSGELFKGRFMNEEGTDLLPAWRMAMDNPVVGFGLLPPAGVIVNDSLYITVLFSGGVIGMILFSLIFVSLFFFRNRDTLQRLTFAWLILMFAAGFGCPSFFNPRMGEWVWAVVAVAALRSKNWSPAQSNAIATRGAAYGGAQSHSGAQI